MAVQLPEEAQAIAGCILAWSFICLASSGFLVHLVWVHNEKKSYVALMGAFTSLSIIASIGQQLNTIINWDDIKIAQWQNVKDNVGNAELNITGASTGADLVLFYIQYYTYNVESMLVFFWAVELAVSVYHIRKINFYSLPASLIAKAIAALLPAVQQVLLRFTVKYHTVTGYMILADFIMILSFGVGCIMLVAILSRYVHARIALISWNVNYGERSGATDLNNPHSSNYNNSNALGSQAGRRPVRQPRMRSIYDRWLVLRFTIAFIALGLFEVVVITFQLRASSTNTAENIPETPDLSAGRAISDFARFAPGVTAGPLMFIVFGTTRTFRDYMARIFLPKGLHARLMARNAHKRKPSGGIVVVTSGLPPPVPPKSPRDLEAARFHAHRSSTHIRMQSVGRTRAQQQHQKEESDEDEWRATDERRDKVETDDELPIMKPAALVSEGPRYHGRQ